MSLLLPQPSAAAMSSTRKRQSDDSTTATATDDVIYLYDAPKPTTPQPDPTATFRRILTTSTLVIIPYRWSRTITEIGATYVITYTTPSGRLLRDPHEAKSYLQSTYTCRCFLEMNLAFHEVFDFKSKTAALALPPPGNFAVLTCRCQQWWLRKTPSEVGTIRRFLGEQTGCLRGLQYDVTQVEVGGRLNFHMAFELAHSGVMPLVFGSTKSIEDVQQFYNSSLLNNNNHPKTASNCKKAATAAAPPNNSLLIPQQEEEEVAQIEPMDILEPLVVLNESGISGGPCKKKGKRTTKTATAPKVVTVIPEVAEPKNTEEVIVPTQPEMISGIPKEVVIQKVPKRRCTKSKAPTPADPLSPPAPTATTSSPGTPSSRPSRNSAKIASNRFLQQLNKPKLSEFQDMLPKKKAKKTTKEVPGRTGKNAADAATAAVMSSSPPEAANQTCSSPTTTTTAMSTSLLEQQMQQQEEPVKLQIDINRLLAVKRK